MPTYKVTFPSGRGYDRIEIVGAPNLKELRKGFSEGKRRRIAKIELYHGLGKPTRTVWTKKRKRRRRRKRKS